MGKGQSGNNPEIPGQEDRSFEEAEGIE